MIDLAAAWRDQLSAFDNEMPLNEWPLIKNRYAPADAHVSLDAFVGKVGYKEVEAHTSLIMRRHKA